MEGFHKDTTPPSSPLSLAEFLYLNESNRLPKIIRFCFSVSVNAESNPLIELATSFSPLSSNFGLIE
ncbi:hypothetical protein L1887_11601 [Cichorium endivia]|nr:hypothetical protein L1887_11601 [Cichorium endivia]